MRFNFIPNYRGHNDGFFCYGPNWFQFTFPGSRKWRRASLIIVWREAALERHLKNQKDA